jgi:hypothetical protein
VYHHPVRVLFLLKKWSKEMSIYGGDVVYGDLLDDNGGSVLTATPGAGTTLPTIGITHDAISMDAHTEAICVDPKDILALLAKIGNGLRGVNADSDERTVVTTVAELQRLRDLVVSKYYPEHRDTIRIAIGDFITLLTDSNVGTYADYSEAERKG